MAYLIARNVSNMTRRGFFSSSVRAALPEEFPDMMKVVTGLEKKELEANLAGKDDPFALNAIVRKPGDGTRANPIQVPSATGQRFVGCLCQGDDSITAIWMNLYEDRPQRCACGFWHAIKKIEYVE